MNEQRGSLLVCAALLGVPPNLDAQHADAAQNEEQFSRIYSEQAYREDPEQLAQILTETHPQPFEFTTEEAFWDTVQEKADQIGESTTFAHFLWHCSEVTATLGCGHTGLGYFNQEDRILPVSLRFPLDAVFLGSRLFVLDPLVNAEAVPVGAEILAINGMRVSELRDAVFAHIPSDGHSTGFPQQMLNGFLSAYVPYQFGFPGFYEVQIEGKAETVQLEPLEQHRYRPRIGQQNECQDRLCLSLTEDKGYARLTVRSFGYYGEAFKVARDTFYTTATGQPKDRGVTPDHAVQQTLSDFVGETDSVLEFAIERATAE